MAPFDFKLENHFVGSTDGTSLQVYELITKSSTNFSSIKKTDWKRVATIPKQDDVDDHHDDASSYDGLLFFDGHGRIEEPEALTMLAQHLNQPRLLVNPEGYCFLQISEFGVHYLRLNDLFNWPHYGVSLVTINPWSRLELKLLLKDDGHEEWEKLRKEKDEVAHLKKELEECQRNSWAILPSTKFIPQSLDAKDMYLATRQRVPPGIFSCRGQLPTKYVSNSQKLADGMSVTGLWDVRLVDEETSTAGSAEWPPLPTIKVFVGRDGAEFDKDNWWYLKTTHPEGGLTMLVYYEGNRSRISVARSVGSIVPLPFSKDLEVFSSEHTLSLFLLYPFGVRLGFAYRPR